MHGTYASNMGITESDLVIAIGARFSDRVYGDSSKFAQHAKILHIDIDPAEINKNINSDSCIVGDVKEVLNKLLPMVNEVKRDEWVNQINEWKKIYPSCYDKDPKDSINPKFICETVNKIAGENTFITTEVGQHQMWTAQFYPFTKPRTFVTFLSHSSSSSVYRIVQ